MHPIRTRPGGPRLLRALALAAVAAFAVGACSAPDTQTTDPSAAPGSDTHPVSLENCGRTVTVETPPQRVVGLNQGTTEILLSLGLADRMVGTATWTDPIRDDLADANAGVERLADNYASLETVLATEPDFVAASFAPTLAEGGSGTFEDYAKVGVPAYLAHTDCAKAVQGQGAGDGARNEKLTMNDIHTDIRELALLMGESPAGEDLVASLDERLDAVEPPEGAEGTTVAFWFANSEAPYMAGGVGAPQIMADELGLTNVFDDRKDEWPQISWEAVAAENPDYLVIGDLTRDSQTAESAEAKIEFLTSNPVTREMDAVRKERFILLAGADMNPSIRTVDGIEKLAAGLA